MKCLEKLNSQQRLAVQSFDQNIMAFAGPGTGKTRVLTSKIAYMFETGILPDSKKILAITFTNKASNEMKTRIGAFNVVDQTRLRIGTFHNFCMWVLKAYGDKINLNRDFTFISTAHQMHLLQKVLKYTNLPMKAKDFKSRISELKNSSLDLKDYAERAKNSKVNNFFDAAMEYQRRMNANNMIDFDDSILLTATLFKEKPGILELYQNAFPFILVDEMQDTNRIQLEIIRLLGDSAKHVMAVADDDQSIYGWRGALPTVIQDFIDILNANKIVLNENYRSPQKVLEIANRLIKFNGNRTEKELVGRANEADDQIKGKIFDNWEGEADWVTDKIKELNNDGVEYRQIIILYRSRHPSLKVIDEKLLEKKIPFQHFGKNFANKSLLLTEFIIAAMKLIADPLNEIILSALMNAFAKRYELNEDFDLYEYYEEKLNSVTLETLSNLFAEDEVDATIKQMATYCLSAEGNTSFVQIFDGLYRALDVETELQKFDESTRYEEKRHLDLLRDRISKSISTSLTEMLAEIDLQDDSNHIDHQTNKVGVSTFHTAKGLEYKAVFIIALEDQFIPGRNGGNLDKVQEERRGLYVAITRAESKLFVTCAKTRPNWNGYLENVSPSRFIKEMLRKEED